jgi:hypothetical protein
MVQYRQFDRFFPEGQSGQPVLLELAGSDNIALQFLLSKH